MFRGVQLPGLSTPHNLKYQLLDVAHTFGADVNYRSCTPLSSAPFPRGKGAERKSCYKYVMHCIRLCRQAGQ